MIALGCNQQYAFELATHWFGIIGALFEAIGGVFFGDEAVYPHLTHESAEDKSAKDRRLSIIIWAIPLTVLPLGMALPLLMGPLNQNSYADYNLDILVLFVISFSLCSIRY